MMGDIGFSANFGHPSGRQRGAPEKLSTSLITPMGLPDIEVLYRCHRCTYYGIQHRRIGCTYDSNEAETLKSLRSTN